MEESYYKQGVGHETLDAQLQWNRPDFMCAA